ncbi:hypothetical protein HQ585_00555 [candidate division KSB1 bacterium]|nr:hypothetical protein [candidate division KSB1 bacterium]
MYKRFFVLMPFIFQFSIGQNILIKDNVFSPYAWATYYAVKKTMPITIDGDLSEWHSIQGVTMDQEVFFFAGQGMSAAKWKGVNDLSGNFKLLWDSEYIYIAAEVIDDQVIEPHGSLVSGPESGSWDDDGIEIMFDNDGCGMSKYYIGDDLHHEFHFVYSKEKPFVFDNFWRPEPGAPQPMFKLPNGGEEPLAYPDEVMEKNDVTSRFSDPPYNGKYVFKKTDSGYNFELKMSLPGAKMVAINEGGHKIGFDICFNDNDSGEGALKQQLHCSGMNGIFWRNCQFFGTLILINQ